MWTVQDERIVALERKLSQVTGVPVNNSEYLQLLQYEPGQYYQQHTDYIVEQVEKPCGVRYATLFLYLNDVYDGGETTFPSLGLSIKPKKGSALLWSNVVDDGTLQNEDPQTEHIAKPVGKGQEKWTANYWVHAYDFRTPHFLHCLY